MIQFRDPVIEPRFQPGDLVRHKRYGYRGVVVAVDLGCQAPDAWYERNQTQPERKQGWYHVLVHDAPRTTYAAETSLEPDDAGEPVNHPWIDRYFSGFADGGYARNDAPWEHGW